MSDTKNLRKLGSKKTTYKFNKPDPKLLETFESQHDNLYMVPFECFEFSSVCPKTGQPDFAKIYINYVPDELCVESKSLKLYLFSFRNSGEFMEDVTNRIAKDLFNLLKPWYLEVYADFNSRGGIYLRPFVSLLDSGLENRGDIGATNLRKISADNLRKKVKAVVHDWRQTKNIYK